MGDSGQSVRRRPCQPLADHARPLHSLALDSLNARMVDQLVRRTLGT